MGPGSPEPWAHRAFPGGGALFGVTAVSADNAWAVGSDLGATIVQHWNGTVWK